MAIKRLSGLYHLRKLKCSRFRLSEHSFGHLPSLQKLVLRECDWSEIGEHSLDSQQNLRELCIQKPINFTHVDLSALVNLNKLVLECLDSFKILETCNKDSLCELDLRNTYQDEKTEAIEAVLEMLPRFENLEILSVSRFRVDCFDISLLSGLPSLKCLSINSFKKETIKLNSDLYISEIKTENKQHHSEPRLPRLEKLELRYCCLKSVNRDMFRELSGLKLLDLSFNKLECLLDGVFSDLVNLEEFSIAHNEISRVSEGIFAGLVKLRKLNLDFNPLKSLEPSAFSHMTNLEEVSLILDYEIELQNLDALNALEAFYKDKIIFVFE